MWEDNNKMDSREVRWGGMNWINLARNKDQWKFLVNMVITLLVPKNIGKFLRA
jgi:hypothetical protein